MVMRVTSGSVKKNIVLSDNFHHHPSCRSKWTIRACFRRQGIAEFISMTSRSAVRKKQLSSLRDDNGKSCISSSRYSLMIQMITGRAEKGRRCRVRSSSRFPPSTASGAAHETTNADNGRDSLSNASTSSSLSPQSTAHNMAERSPPIFEPSSDNIAMKTHKMSLRSIPNALTVLRVLLVPLLVLVDQIQAPQVNASLLSCTIFALAALTDWLDGWLARKMSVESAFGKFLDPVADKLMVAAALVLLCTRPAPGLSAAAAIVPTASIVIICREVAVSALREWAASESKHASERVAVSSLGKWKTATQLLSLSMLLCSRAIVAPGQPLHHFVFAAETIGRIGAGLLSTAAILAIISAAQYVQAFLEVSPSPPTSPSEVTQ